jgi:hypothetical protein
VTVDTPVVLIIYRRPAQTSRVFQQIRAAQPRDLFVIADGPRSARENFACELARIEVERVDWPCHVRRIYSPSNLGCKKRVFSGLNFVFEEVQSAIILEDDCIPDLSFFSYCEELLLRYRYSDLIMMISGQSCFSNNTTLKDSYFFSKSCLIWGWATWRRAWKLYDPLMSVWPKVRDTSWLEDFLGNRNETVQWKSAFDEVYSNSVDTWDRQWAFSCWQNNGLSIVPRCNLIQNIGFGSRATHTRKKVKFAGHQSSRIDFPLIHPQRVIWNSELDRELKLNLSILGKEEFFVRLVREFGKTAKGILKRIRARMGRQGSI